MAPKKGSTSSKTAHVLNLLGSGSRTETEPTTPTQKEEVLPITSTTQVPHQEQEPQTEIEQKQEIKSENTQGRHLSPPILEVARTNHNAISESIHNALENALQAELEEQHLLEPSHPTGLPTEKATVTEVPRPVMVEEPKVAEIPQPVTEEKPKVTEIPQPAAEEEPKVAEIPQPAAEEEPKVTEIPQPAAEEEPKVAEISQPAAEEEPRVAEISQPAAEEEPKMAEVAQPAVPEDQTSTKQEIELEHFYDQLEDGSEFVNVMQILVEEKIEKYVKMFKLCQCPRCMSDVEALALSRLPAQYVVLSSKNKIPLLTVYRSKYDSQVTTQIIYACKEVMETPRH